LFSVIYLGYCREVAPTLECFLGDLLSIFPSLCSSPPSRVVVGV